MTEGWFWLYIEGVLYRLDYGDNGYNWILDLIPYPSQYCSFYIFPLSRLSPIHNDTSLVEEKRLGNCLTFKGFNQLSHL